MSSSDLIRWSGIGAVLGSLLGIVLAPVITSAYSLSEGGPEQSPPWDPALSNLLSPLFGFASPEGVYATYGKLYFLVFLGFLLGFLACVLSTECFAMGFTSVAKHSFSSSS